MTIRKNVKTKQNTLCYRNAKNKHNNNHDNNTYSEVYSAVVMAKVMQKFTR